MTKTRYGYNALVETSKNNYYIELIKIGRGKYSFDVYNEGDCIWSWTARDGKKSTFSRIFEIFRLHNNVGKYEFLDY